MLDSIRQKFNDKVSDCHQFMTDKRNATFIALAALGYGLAFASKFTQVWVGDDGSYIMPQTFRFYAADVIAMIPCCLSAYALGQTKNVTPEKVAISTFTGWTAFEVYSFYISPLVDWIPKAMGTDNRFKTFLSGPFDWKDVVAYGIGSAAGYGAIKYLNNKLS